MQNKTVFQFISEPSDINYGGNVHGGSVMKWIDQAGYACASSWASSYCVTVYVGGIRFYSPIKIGHIVKVEAEVIYTGTTSMHIAINVFSRNIKRNDFMGLMPPSGSAGRIRTYDQPINSRLLYH